MGSKGTVMNNMSSTKISIISLIEERLFEYVYECLKDDALFEYTEISNHNNTDIATFTKIVQSRVANIAIVDISRLSDDGYLEKVNALRLAGALNYETGDMTEFLIVYADDMKREMHDLQQELISSDMCAFPLRYNNERGKRLFYQGITSTIKRIKLDCDRYELKKAEIDRYTATLD